MTQRRQIGESAMEISSKADPNSGSFRFNPASFVVDMNNTNKANRIVKVCPTKVAVPRLFPNISVYNNTLLWYQRRVVEVATGLPAPQDWLRTVLPVWEVTASLTIPDDIYNIDQILALINTLRNPAGETWTFDTGTMSIIINVAAPGPPANPFGYFTGPFVPSSNVFAPMTFMTGGGTEILDTLGLQGSAFETSVEFKDNLAFNPANPNSFDTTVGSNLQGQTIFQLFDRASHSYASWIANPYVTPKLNKPQLQGPQIIHVLLSDLGDSSTIDARTGILRDRIVTLHICTTEFGGVHSEEVHDVDAESIPFHHAKSITTFRVQLVDSLFRQLYLARNVEVNLDLKLWYQED